MKAPLLSVIMPVYNAEKYVYQAIDSIVKQTFTDFEFLIFDDGSTDSSLAIIRSFDDPRLVVYAHAVNTGYVKHLNEGLHLAQGKYIARMDADDVSLIDRFQKQITYLEQHEDVALCGSWIEFIGSQQGVLDYPVYFRDIATHLLLFGNAIAHPSVMLRKSVLTAHHLTYDGSLEPAEDYDLWCRLYPGYKLFNLPEVLLQYRMHDQNESVVKKAKQDRAVAIIREKVIMRHVVGSSDKVVKAFILDKQPDEALTIAQLKNIRLYVKDVLRTKLYNDEWVKIALGPRFAAWCKASAGPGYLKCIQYLLFPKHFFSIRICLSLLINR